MFGLQPRIVGFAMLGVAAILLLVATLIGWGAIQRWRAIAAIEDHHLARLAGRANSARDSAQRAAAILPDSAMAALPAIDPSAEDAGARLERLLRAAEPRDRAVVAATVVFSAALRGGAVDRVDGADGVLLGHLAALAKDGLRPFPALPADDAPQAAILAQAAQRHVAAAWAAGDREQLARGLGMVLLTRPTHPDIRPVATLLAALDPAVERGPLGNLVGASGGDPIALLRRAALLAPERAPLLFALIPPDKRRPEEARRVLAASGGTAEPLEAQVAKGLASPSPALLASLFARCLEQDRTDLARQLAEKAAEPQRRDLRIALARHLGDVSALAALQPERTDLAPLASPPVAGVGLVAFHLGTASGMVPRVGDLRARVDDAPIPPERIKRWGSLVVLLLPGKSGMVDLDVTLGGTSVFAGGVRL